MSISPQDVVADELARAGLQCSIAQHAALVAYLRLLERWGQRVDLTAQPEPEVVARRLLPDALVLAAQLAGEPQRAVDVGAGSGIVGIVLGILRPELELLLVEPNARRSSFLRTVIHQLGLRQLSVAQARLEALALAPCELALSRATWSPAEWLSRALPLLCPAGRAVAFLVAGRPLPAAPASLLLERELDYRLHDGSARQLAFYRRGPG